MYDKEKKTVYMTAEIIKNVQKFADNVGLSWNSAVSVILHDYFNEERKVLVAHLKGEKGMNF